LANPVTGKLLAGHLNELVVGATAEIIVRAFGGEVGRTVCPKTGLNILDFS
jgi:predicted DNA-binding protein with PD1-like motif